jgi:hypothetical protein
MFYSKIFKEEQYPLLNEEAKEKKTSFIKCDILSDLSKSA